MAEVRKPASDLKPGDAIEWNGVRYVVSRVEARPAPYVSSGATRLFVHLTGRDRPLVLEPGLQVRRG